MAKIHYGDSAFPVTLTFSSNECRGILKLPQFGESIGACSKSWLRFYDEFLSGNETNIALSRLPERIKEGREKFAKEISSFPRR